MGQFRPGPEPTCLTMTLHCHSDHMVKNGRSQLGEGEHGRRLKEDTRPAQYQRKDPKKKTKPNSKAVTPSLVFF